MAAEMALAALTAHVVAQVLFTKRKSTASPDMAVFPFRGPGDGFSEREVSCRQSPDAIQDQNGFFSSSFARLDTLACGCFERRTWKRASCAASFQPQRGLPGVSLSSRTLNLHQILLLCLSSWSLRIPVCQASINNARGQMGWSAADNRFPLRGSLPRR
ncbi:hypothetical protein EV126DRAFT_77355 [Verticillium dahliae]|nr:hypothetical protein EV126DRAFT_77355 [Verticillium dahliae]